MGMRGELAEPIARLRQAMEQNRKNLNDFEARLAEYEQVVEQLLEEIDRVFTRHMGSDVIIPSQKRHEEAPVAIEQMIADLRKR